MVTLDDSFEWEGENSEMTFEIDESARKIMLKSNIAEVIEEKFRSIE